MARYVEMLFRHWIAFLILLVIIPAGLAVASVKFFPVHQASATMWVENPTYFGNTAVGAGWNQYLTPAQNETDSFAQMVQTGAFRQQVGDKLLEGGVVSTPAERDRVVNAIGTATGLTIRSSGSHLVTVGFTCERAPVCLKVISFAIDLYYQQFAELQQQQAAVASDFFTGELTTAQQTLKTSEHALQLYVSTHPAVTTLAGNADPQLDTLTAQVTQDQQEVQNLQQRIDNIRLTRDVAIRLAQSISPVVDQPHMAGVGLRTSLKNAILGWLACLAAAGTYLLLLVWLDRTVRDPNELERRLNTKVIVTIPHFAGMAKS